MYSGPEKGVLVFKIRSTASRPPLVCLTAIFAKICRKRATEDKAYSGAL